MGFVYVQITQGALQPVQLEQDRYEDPCCEVQDSRALWPLHPAQCQDAAKGSIGHERSNCLSIGQECGICNLTGGVCHYTTTWKMEYLHGGAPGLLPEHAQGDQLHERVHADNQVRLVAVKRLADLARHEQRGDGLRRHMDEARLLPVVADTPDQAVADHERVGPGQLVERVRCVVGPDVHIVHLTGIGTT